MSDTLYDGRRIRALTIIAEGNREGLDIAVGISLPSRRVMRVLEDLVMVHGRPVAVRVDNGPEFLAQSFVEWAAAHRVAVHYSQPGKPDQNAYIERFNGTYRVEVLDANRFETLADVRAETERWLPVYNEQRIHSAIGDLPPRVFKQQWQQRQNPEQSLLSGGRA